MAERRYFGSQRRCSTCGKELPSCNGIVIGNHRYCDELCKRRHVYRLEEKVKRKADVRPAPPR